MTIPKTQKAWMYTEYGPKEVLHITEIEVPKPTPTQVLVKVHAAALNPADYKLRLAYFKDRSSADGVLPRVPGLDVAGVIDQVGSEVTKFKKGDRVYAEILEDPLSLTVQGCLAQYCVVEEKLIAEIPERLSFAEAASLPLAVETAYEALELAGLKEGQTVLILGGAGGVGTLAIQLAKHVFKASLVAATTSTPKVEFLRGLGADVVIDYKKESLAEHPKRYDVVLDSIAKGETLLGLKEGGKAVVISGKSAEPPAVRMILTSRGDILETLKPFLQDGILRPIIDAKGEFKFSEVVEAFGYLETGRVTGKVVISPIE